jgi:hypothetical protein
VTDSSIHSSVGKKLENVMTFSKKLLLQLSVRQPSTWYLWALQRLAKEVEVTSPTNGDGGGDDSSSSDHCLPPDFEKPKRNRLKYKPPTDNDLDLYHKNMKRHVLGPGIDELKNDRQWYPPTNDPLSINSHDPATSLSLYATSTCYSGTH